MFIRTKDGIYVLSEAYWAGNEDEIIKQSDNLAKLCDEFLVMDNGRCMEMFSNYDDLKNSGWYRSDIDIYGAIYTDKGLIHVAKMDKNGELMLL